jgi:hypothetical protein
MGRVGILVSWGGICTCSALGVDKYCLYISCLISMRDATRTHSLTPTHRCSYLYSDWGRSVDRSAILCLRMPCQERTMKTYKLLPYGPVYVKMTQAGEPDASVPVAGHDPEPVLSTLPSPQPTPLCELRCYHSGEYENSFLLRCCTV